MAAHSISYAIFGLGISMAISFTALSYGIGRIVIAAVEGIARQPEAATDIKETIFLPVFMIEGVGLGAVLFPFLLMRIILT